MKAKYILACLIIGSLILGIFLFTFSSNFLGKKSLSNEAYTKLTIRFGKNAILEFGDTEYEFSYIGSLIMRASVFGSKWYMSPRKGDVYIDLGIEIKVEDVNSDYISQYIVLLVKPTTLSYAKSFFYTKINITLYNFQIANISSGLIEKTNTYKFAYTYYLNAPPFYSAGLTITLNQQSQKYVLYFANDVVPTKDLEIETLIYKIEPEYLVIYVKPLY